MNEHERRTLLERLEREGARVGTDIPEEVEVQGETVPLREFVFEIKRRDGVAPGDRERVERAKKNLRRERLARKQRLEDDPELTHGEGEQLVESIVGLDRALTALEDLEGTDLEAEAQARENADRKRWLQFLETVQGRGGGGRSPL